MPSLITQYRDFQKLLNGYADVPFGVFRDQLLPLRQRRHKWSLEEEQLVRGLAEKGARYALQQFMGPAAQHPAAARAIGSEVVHPEPMPRAELDLKMKNLIRNCQSAGWSSQSFSNFAVYLDSAMTPQQLADKDKEAQLSADLQTSFASKAWLRQESRGPGPEAAVPDRDEFADQYRDAGTTYQNVVKDYLAAAAEKAKKALPARVDDDGGRELRELRAAENE